MSAEAVVFPSQYEAARKWLFLHAVYGIVASTAAALHPAEAFQLLNPALSAIENYTGLAHFEPQTPEEHKTLVTALAFSIGIGSIYFLYSGPFWNRGGRVLVEGSIWTRLMYVASSYAFCFLTPYGSSLLFLIASIDVVSVLLLKWTIGSSWGQLLFGRTRTVSVSSTKKRK